MQEVRDLIMDLVGLSGDKVIAISDLSIIGRSMAHFLKFIEEAKFNLIFLASEDNIPAVVLSRFMTIRKNPDLIEHLRDSPAQFKSEMGDEPSQAHILDLTIKYHPAFLRVHRTLRRRPVASKIMEILLC